MSTRAEIGFYPSKKSGIEDWKALIYVHSDGPSYPFGDDFQQSLPTTQI